MSTEITDNEMRSTVTRHTASAVSGSRYGSWTVTWLPGICLSYDQAITAMTIAEFVMEHLDELADNTSRWWLFIDGWAAELGITGPHAVAEASLSPEDHQVPREQWPSAEVPEPTTMTPGHEDEPKAPWRHVDCGGVVMFGLSGGYCTSCEAEDLVEDEYTQRHRPGTCQCTPCKAAAQQPQPALGDAERLAIALAALRQIDQDGDDYSARKTAEEALSDIADLNPRLQPEPQPAPELAARRAAAAAVLADYQREAAAASTADLAVWAVRMADMLGHVLAVLDEGGQA